MAMNWKFSADSMILSLSECCCQCSSQLHCRRNSYWRTKEYSAQWKFLPGLNHELVEISFKVSSLTILLLWQESKMPQLELLEVRRVCWLVSHLTPSRWKCKHFLTYTVVYGDAFATPSKRKASAHSMQDLPHHFSPTLLRILCFSCSTASHESWFAGCPVLQAVVTCLYFKMLVLVVSPLYFHRWSSVPWSWSSAGNKHSLSLRWESEAGKWVLASFFKFTWSTCTCMPFRNLTENVEVLWHFKF